MGTGLHADADLVTEALSLPIREGFIAWPERVLFLRARASFTLEAAKSKNIFADQSFKPFFDMLPETWKQGAGEHAHATFPLVMILPPKQRDEARALYARAVSLCEDKGTIIASISNDEGAKSGERDLQALLGNIQSLSKHKCRVFWGVKQNIEDRVFNDYLAHDIPRVIPETGLWSRPGVFAWDRIDQASRLLIKHLPNNISGQLADLGAGIGYLAKMAISQNPLITHVDLYEAEHRALECSRLNLKSEESKVVIQYYWHDVTRGLDKHYDVIVSNPPFHQGREDLPALGQAFIREAAKALKKGGYFFMVANRHLPYEAQLQNHFTDIRVLSTEDGFKVIAARKMT
jgi:16S rRNA (guanine1207-N2)-methyltransferase